MNTSGLLRASLFGLLVLVIAVLAVQVQSEGLTTDFPSFFAASGTLASGANPYDVQQLTSYARERGFDGVVYPYLYPPFLASMMTPLTRLLPEQADQMWGALMAVLFALSAVLMTLAPHTDPRSSTRSVTDLLLPVTLLLMLPLAQNFQMGQVNALVMACLTLAVVGMERGGRAWQRAAGIALAVAALIKVTPALLLVLLLARNKTTAVWSFLATCAAGVALSVAISGVDVWGQFLTFVPGMSYGRSLEGMFHPMFVTNLSLSAFVMRAAQDAGPAVRLVSIVAVVFLLAMLLWAMMRHRHSEGRQGLLLATLVLMVVVSPYTWFHHLVFLFPGLVLMFRDLLASRRHRGGWPMLVLCSLLVPGVAINFPELYSQIDIPEAIRPFVTSLNLFLLLGLFAAALRWAGLRPVASAGRALSAVRPRARLRGVALFGLRES